MLAIISKVGSNLKVVLICIHLMAKDGEHFTSTYGPSHFLRELFGSLASFWTGLLVFLLLTF